MLFWFFRVFFAWCFVVFLLVFFGFFMFSLFWGRGADVIYFFVFDWFLDRIFQVFFPHVVLHVCLC